MVLTSILSGCWLYAGSSIEIYVAKRKLRSGAYLGSPHVSFYFEGHHSESSHNNTTGCSRCVAQENGTLASRAGRPLILFKYHVAGMIRTWPGRVSSHQPHL
jgi:hypothetical protein